MFGMLKQQRRMAIRCNKTVLVLIFIYPRRCELMGKSLIIKVFLLKQEFRLLAKEYAGTPPP